MALPTTTRNLRHNDTRNHFGAPGSLPDAPILTVQLVFISTQGRDSSPSPNTVQLRGFHPGLRGLEKPRQIGLRP